MRVGAEGTGTFELAGPGLALIGLCDRGKSGVTATQTVRLFSFYVRRDVIREPPELQLNKPLAHVVHAILLPAVDLQPHACV